LAEIVLISKNGVKYYASLKQKKIRNLEGKFLIEGFHLVEECLNSSYILECVFVSEKTKINKYDKLFSRLEKKNIPLHYLKNSLFEKISDTESSQGIAAAVLKIKQGGTEKLMNSKTIIVLDRINDPGNLGTIIRTAYWFGIDAVILSENSVDLYNPKVVRSTQGALFNLNILENAPLVKTLGFLASNSFNIYLLDADAKKDLQEIESGKKAVFVFGSEAEGISAELLNKDYKCIKIEGYSNCESLNVAVSFGIVMHYYKNKS
jgi:RNA methyltransferase, TrmH family